MVDTTIYGMGKGAGNLPCELLLGYLKYDIKNVMNFIENYMIDLFKKYEWGYLHKYMITGLYNSTTRYGEFIMNDKNNNYNNLIEIVSDKSINKLKFTKDISNKKISVCIPIKLNNERCPGKNTRLLNGKPLCHYLFEVLLEVKKEIDIDIYVFCSDESFKEYLLPNIIFLKRESWLDSNKITFNILFEEFKKIIKSDYYILSHVTSPFIKLNTFINSIKKVIYEGYDSCFPVKNLNDFIWIDNMSNYNSEKIPRTQDINNTYMEIPAFYIFTNNVYEEYKTRIGKNPYKYLIESEECIDIDTEEDFKNAEIFNII